MALPTPSGFDVALVSLATVECQDHLAEGSIDFGTNNTTLATWGGVVSTAGSKTATGTWDIVLDETSGSPYITAETEYFAQTAGGIAAVVEPKGTGTGNRRYAFNNVITNMQIGGAGGDVQRGVFPWILSGAITATTQS